MSHENIPNSKRLLTNEEFDTFYMDVIRLALGNPQATTPLSENVEQVLNAIIEGENNPAFFLPKAAQLGSFDVVRFILDNNLAGTSINDKDPDGNDALHYVM